MYYLSRVPLKYRDVLTGDLRNSVFFKLQRDGYTTLDKKKFISNGIQKHIPLKKQTVSYCSICRSPKYRLVIARKSTTIIIIMQEAIRLQLKLPCVCLYLLHCIMDRCANRETMYQIQTKTLAQFAADWILS